MRILHPLLIGILTAAAVASPASAEDLLFKYRKAHVGPLKAYDAQPYWRVLGECAGVHGALSNQYEATGDTAAAEAAKARGVAMLKAANNQLRADRGLAEREALQLTAAAVDTGREAGVVMLARKPASGFTNAQLIDLACTQLSESHARARRFR